MSKVTIEIPDRVKHRVIYIMAGTENIGVICENTYYKKTALCSMCGKCCVVDKQWELGWKYGDFVDWEPHILVCKHLEREIWNFEPFNGQVVYVCHAGVKAPYGCSVGPSPACGKKNFKKNFPECTLEYSEEEL
jgi:hypothetical protein